MPTADGVLARRLARLIGGALCLVAGAAVAVPAILLHPAPAELLSGVAVSVAVALGAAVVWLARQLLASQAHLDTRRDERIATLVDGAVDPTVAIDRIGTIRAVSGSVTDELGYLSADLLGAGVDSFVSPPDVAPILAMLGRGPDATARVECRVRHRDGRWLTIEAVGQRPEIDRVTGDLVLTLRGVTRWKALEEELTRQAHHDALTGLPNRALFVD